jgi:hypothetical protein
VAKNLNEWMQEGQQLYDAAIEDYRKLEEEAAELQQKLSAKRQEVNQIAKVIGKPGVEEPRTAPVLGGPPPVEVVDAGTPGSAPYTRNSIARALTGQPLRR